MIGLNSRGDESSFSGLAFASQEEDPGVAQGGRGSSTY